MSERPKRKSAAAAAEAMARALEKDAEDEEEVEEIEGGREEKKKKSPPKKRTRGRKATREEDEEEEEEEEEEEQQESSSEEEKPKRKKKKDGAAAGAPKIRAVDARKEMTGHVKTMHQMVDDDWHDGYEQQEEFLADTYFEDWFKWLGHVRSIVESSQVLQPKQAQLCHEILLAVSDSWRNMATIGARIDFGESEQNFMEEPGPLDSLSNAFRLVLLASAAGGAVPDDQMCRMIKDAVDNGCTEATTTALTEKEPSGKPHKIGAEVLASAIKAEKSGSAKLQTFVTEKKATWKALPSTLKKHARKRVLDRRYDGSPSRRTRWFEEDEEEYGSDREAADETYHRNRMFGGRKQMECTLC